MSPQTVIVLTWVAAGTVVALYVWFVVWRVRVDRRKKAAADDDAARMTAAIERAAALAAAAPPVTPRPPERAEPAEPAPERVEPAPVSPSAPAATVAGALAGIRLPHDLVPLTTMTDRPGVGDRIAFWTDTAPADVVGPAFGDELERLGYTTIPIDEKTLSAQRDGERLLVVIHPDGRRATIGDQPAFTSVPEMAIVIEVWLPA